MSPLRGKGGEGERDKILMRTVPGKGRRTGKGAERERVPRARVGLGGRRPGEEGTRPAGSSQRGGSRSKESSPLSSAQGSGRSTKGGGARAEGPPGE